MHNDDSGEMLSSNNEKPPNEHHHDQRLIFENNLIHDIWMEIVSFMDDGEILRMRCVCKQWNEWIIDMDHSCPYWSDCFTKILKYSVRKRKKLLYEKNLVLNNRASFLYLLLLRKIVDEWKYVTRSSKISSGVDYSYFITNIENESSKVTEMRNQIIPYSFITKIQTTPIMERKTQLGYSHHFEIYVFDVKGLGNVLKLAITCSVYQNRFEMVPKTCRYQFYISYSKVMQEGNIMAKSSSKNHCLLKYDQSQYQPFKDTIVELMNFIGLDDSYTQNVDCLREFMLVLCVDTTITTKSIKHPLTIDRRNFSSYV
ncbi:hypothetical protein C9374_006264 [Naegleria lovaniensis]|uniref:F-box domain-containing protein n=1 Tax=Naegleria lovaniensis TaxID=51637 RepID=A0AA88KJ80_NAELO|nr:uncharacterized protein C9374_006264 [Naegleria lovaniensis]KAG2381275.1 hypothetical protein C9374_006264 [Naegleria lovaniensis]